MVLKPRASCFWPKSKILFETLETSQGNSCPVYCTGASGYLLGNRLKCQRVQKFNSQGLQRNFTVGLNDLSVPMVIPVNRCSLPDGNNK